MASNIRGIASYRILPMQEPNFDHVAKQLEETLSKLKGTKDPEQRKLLLRAMRRLLVEADRLNLNRQS